jgi:hypothetical protein
MAGQVIDDGIRPAHEWSPWSADNTDHLREQGTVCAKISVFALVATLLLMVRARPAQPIIRCVWTYRDHI